MRDPSPHEARGAAPDGVWNIQGDETAATDFEKILHRVETKIVAEGR